MNPYVKKIQSTSRTGLWGSVGVVIATALFHYVSPWRFYPTAYTARFMLICATVLAVLVVSAVLLTVRRRIPQLRQAEGMEKKLSGYASYVSGIYWSTLVAVVIICALTILSAQSGLLMLAMVATLTLFLAYPNIYKLKTDLGLNDEEMRSLYGDKYMSDNAQD